jgi:hypothetical protein
MKCASGIVALTLSVFLGGSAALAQTLPTLARPVTLFQLKPVSSAPITLHLTDDSKTIYLAIGKLAGLDVLFDPDYVSKRIQVDVTHASLSDSLRIVGEVSGTFYKPLAPDTIFVALNNHQKHQDLDDQEYETYYLKNANYASDANELYTALRNMLPADSKSYLVPSQNAIIMHSTPDNLALAQKIINDLDRPKKIYRLTYTVTDMDGTRRVGLQHFALVVASGQQATLKQGSKVPVATGTYNATATTGPNAAPAGTQTNFTYLDVGMNFDATPTSVGDGISLKTAVEQLSIADEKSGVGPQDPIVKQTSLKSTLLVPPGKPIMLGSIDLPGTTHHLDIEVTAEQLP